MQSEMKHILEHHRAGEGGLTIAGYRSNDDGFADHSHFQQLRYNSWY